MYKNATRYTKTLQDIRERYKMYENATRCTRTLQNVQKRYKKYENATKCYKNAMQMLQKHNAAKVRTYKNAIDTMYKNAV